ncbi:MAG: Mur ligase family protein [Cyclobacteriaceae bacterium]
MDNFIEFLYSKFLQSDGASVEPKQDHMVFILDAEGENTQAQVDKALAAGASYVVVGGLGRQTSDKVILSKTPVLEALREVAIFHRSRHKRKVIAVTGGARQQEVINDLMDVLSQNYIVHTSKEQCNEVEVLLAILAIYPQVEVTIIGMQAQNLGDVAALCQLVKQQYGLVTQFENTHMEAEESLRAYSELLDYLRKTEGTPIINTNDPKQQNMARRFQNAILYSDEPSSHESQTSDLTVSVGKAFNIQ